jgi:PAS domain S-box-containing protein
MERYVSKEGGGAEAALSSREQELRLLVEAIPALVSRTGPAGNVAFTAQLQAILNVLPAYTWYATPSGALIFVNKRTADYLGVPKDHPQRSGVDIGAQWDDWVPLLHPDDQEEARKYWSYLLRTGEGGEHSYRVRGAEGDYRWFLTRIEPLRASDGTLLLWIGATLDIEELKRAEQALRESEYKLRQIIETVPAFLWSTGPDGEPTHISQRILDYSGMRLEDFKRGGWEAFVHPADFPETFKALEHAIQTGTSFEAVHRLRRSDGEYRWHHARGEPLRDREGRVVQWYGLSVDIEERKRAEDRLRRSEAYLADSQRLSHTGTWVLNPTTNQYLYWSEEMNRIWGLDPLQGFPSRETVRQGIHPDDRNRVWEKVQEALRQKKDYSGEFRIVLPNGTVKYLTATSHHLFSTNGELVEVIGTNVDVTERKHAEQALRQSEAKIRRLVDANIIGIFIWDIDGRIVEANDAFLRLVGYDREDIVSGRMRWAELTPPEWFATHEGRLAELKETGSLWLYEKEYFRKDGSRVPVLTGGATFEEGGNQGVAFVLDLTERKRAEERLRVQHTVAQILTEAATIEEATPRILLAMGECLGWDVGVLWLVDREAAALRCVELWHKASVDVPEFERASRESTFGPGLGLPGRVWSSLEPEYIPDVVPDENFPRAPIAEREGLRAAFGFPILLGGEVLGVIEFFSREIRRPDQELLSVLAAIGSQIGQFIERKRAEDLLRRSEAHLAEAQRLSHTGAVVYNGTAILFASEETYRVWGFDPAQGLPDREVVFQRIHPADRDWLNAEVRRAVSEKRRYSVAYRILMPDGTVKHLETIGQPVFSASGELVEIFATQTDVTERKRAEEALRESEAKFRDYAETASDWFWEIGPDYKFTLLTENAFGSRPADRIGTPCWDHALDLETEPEKWRLLRTALDSRKPFRDFVYRGLGGNGSPMYVKASGKPVSDADGEFRGYRGTGTDVTALVRAQEQHERLRQLESDLAHMNRVSMMGELAASLSHEITQPIASARNNARAAQNFLDMQPPDLSEVREALSCVVGDTDRAGDIVDRIRDHIKKTPPRKEHFDLNEAINEVIELGRSAIIKNGVWVQTRLSEGLSPIYCDRVQLQQVVLNLILNAAEAMGSVEGAPRDLLISSEQDHTGVLVAVRDSGPGINPDHLERVFEAFYTTKSRGVGMGLSICRSIIDAHGGRLWAEANKPRGTIFQFTLPSA